MWMIWLPNLNMGGGTAAVPTVAAFPDPFAATATATITPLAATATATIAPFASTSALKGS